MISGKIPLSKDIPTGQYQYSINNGSGHELFSIINLNINELEEPNNYVYIGNPTTIILTGDNAFGYRMSHSAWISRTNTSTIFDAIETQINNNTMNLDFSIGDLFIESGEWILNFQSRLLDNQNFKQKITMPVILIPYYTPSISSIDTDSPFKIGILSFFEITGEHFLPNSIIEFRYNNVSILTPSNVVITSKTSITGEIFIPDSYEHTNIDVVVISGDGEYKKVSESYNMLVDNWNEE